MQTRQLGNSDLHLTTIGLGTWGISGGHWPFGWGEQDENEAVAAIVRALELGINWIDTAPVYGNGRSEELVAKALQQIGASDRPILATKCSRVFQPDGSIDGVLKKESVIDECHQSLKRLGVDTIDLYQIHWPIPEDDIEEGWDALVELKEAGKVRHIGVSNFNAEHLKRVGSIHPVTSLQPPYSMIAPEIEDETLPYCGQEKIGVICYSPMCKGLLTGSFTKERATNLPEDDHRSRDLKFQEPQLSVNLALVDGLTTIANRHDRSVAQLAIAWTLRREEVTAAIVGARRPSQIEGTVAAGDWDLTADEIAEIDDLMSERKRKLEALGATETGRV